MSSGYPSGLTASAFEMLIHYFWSPIGVDGEMERGHHHYEALQELSLVGLVELNKDPKTACWVTTARGNALARHILNVPLPVSETVWRIPEGPALTQESKP